MMHTPLTIKTLHYNAYAFMLLLTDDRSNQQPLNKQYRIFSNKKRHSLWNAFSQTLKTIVMSSSQLLYYFYLHVLDGFYRKTS